MKVLVIGSGPIVIGQAAEFDYAGTQACKSLKEEGHEVVLINSNPATIMTDPGVADALYIEPLNVDFCERVIARERPDALLPTLGGQTGLNLATQLSDSGILEKYNVKLLGTPLSAIRKAEDREQFRDLMREIKEPVPESWIVETPADIEAILGVVPYPCIVRPAYTLGGTGGGVAHSPEELREIGTKGLKLSMRSQLMIERSLLGWKEVEYEVMRDKAGNCITVCNMENFDPMGVHTGDSIVVAPSQTLSDIEYHMLRTASLKIIQALGIEGGCNVQLAVNPDSFDYYIIEVNPRVSRSSALASKATGYPIARVAAKIAVGKTLDEIENQVTGSTKACFEPALDYCVVKIPRWPFDKFATGDRSLFTQMKATGEVMAIDRTFEAAFMKAIRGLEVKQKDLRHEKFQGSGSWHGRPARDPETEAPDPRMSLEYASEFLDTDVEKRKGAFLPHWTQEGAIYAVTYRLADALPASKLEEIRNARALIEQQKKANTPLTGEDLAEAERLFSEKVDSFLDAGEGACVLKDPRTASIVRENLLHFDGERYHLHAWCVMPNHVHVIVEPLGDNKLSSILHSWKSFTSKAIRGLRGEAGELWMSEYYDHLIRHQLDYNRQVRYVEKNPEKAKLSNWEFVSSPPQVLGRIMGEEIGIQQPIPKTEEPTQANGTPGSWAGRPSHGPGAPMPDALLRSAIQKPTDERLWAIAEGLRRGWSVDEVNKLSRVDKWFLRKMRNLLDVERRLLAAGDSGTSEDLGELVKEAFLIGFPSPSIRSLLGVDLEKIANPNVRELPELLSKEHMAGEIDRQKVMPVFKMVDTCAGEFESRTPYYYGTFEQEDDAV